MPNIICAAGKGEMSYEDCLNCALTGNNICGFDYSMLSRMLAPDGRSPGIHVSDLVGCPLKAYNERVIGNVPEYIHHKLAIFLGKSVHAYLEDHVSPMYSNEVPLEGWGVVGTADVVTMAGRVVDYKTVRKMDKYFLPYNSHKLQLNIYAAMLEAKGTYVNELAIQYISTDGPTRCPTCRKMVIPGGEFGYQCPICGKSKQSYHPGVYLIPVQKMDTQEIQDLIQSRASDLEACIALQSPPRGEPSWVCAFCKYKEACPDKE